jgi:hypothetical protein
MYIIRANNIRLLPVNGVVDLAGLISNAVLFSV